MKTGVFRTVSRVFPRALSVVTLLGGLAIMPIPVIAASDTWSNIETANDVIAVTPQHRFHIYLAERPMEAVWGKLDIPISEELLPELHKHRKSPNFPFINVAVEVDSYYRVMQGRIYDDDLKVEVDLDLRQWDGLKKGNRLKIGLPDGTEYEESLKGSGNALRNIERR